MARPSRSFLRRNRTTRAFRDLYAKLPSGIQELVRRKAELFDKYPTLTSWRTHTLKPNHRGSHLPDSVSVAVAMGYRAIYVESDGVRTWYWVGVHASYNRFTGVK